MVVANHPGGRLDGILLVVALGRMPRIVTSSQFWRAAVTRSLLRFHRALPIDNAADRPRTGRPPAAISNYYPYLAAGSTVAIFPEGGDTAEPVELQRIRSGAARLALGALSAAPDLVIVPIGIATENRFRRRDRALLIVGEPIEVAQYGSAGVGATGEPDRDDVTKLTARIGDALRAVAPQFSSLDDCEVYRAAALEEQRDATGRIEPRFGDVEAVARRLGQAQPDARRAVEERYGRFAAQLQLAGISARQLRAEPVAAARIALTSVAFALAAILVAVAAALHTPAIAVTAAVTGRSRPGFNRMRARLLAGVLSSICTWVLVALWVANGWWSLAVGLLVAGSAVASVVAWSPVLHHMDALIGRARTRYRRHQLTPVIETRAALVAAVRAALDNQVAAS